MNQRLSSRATASLASALATTTLTAAALATAALAATIAIAAITAYGSSATPRAQSALRPATTSCSKAFTVRLAKDAAPRWL